ncbi:MAG: EAL domain-containing protein [Proteobacteria bacterium]|nr:EAL domain-containing protein [Pseudomonadota bacterium]
MQKIEPMSEEVSKFVRSVQLRIALPALLTVALFVAAMSFFFIPSLKTNLVARELGGSRHLTQVAINILQTYETRVQAGMLSLEQAQSKAVQDIRFLRYGDDGLNYFWIQDTRPVMIMHPYRPDLENMDLSDMTDLSGKRLFIDFVAASRDKGYGVVDYMWQRQDQPDRVEPKSSYVQLFRPWGWIVGTGTYVEDVQDEISKTVADLWVIIALVTFLALFPTGWVIFQARAGARERRRIWKEREGLIHELSEHREQHRSLVNNIAIGVMQVDRDLRVQTMNSQMREWFLDADLESAPRCQDIFGMHHQVGTCTDCPARLTLQSAGVHEMVREQQIHGLNRFLRIVSSPVLNAQGEVSSVILTLDDITDRLRGERALKEAEAKYRGIFENSLEGIYQTSLEGRVLSVNPALVQVFGYETSEEFIQTINDISCDIYVNPNRRGEFLATMERDGFVRGFESEVLTQAGRKIWILENARAVRDESGKITHFDGTMLDITDRKETELALDHQRAYFQELFESSPLGIVLLDNDGTVLKANKGFEALFGYKSEDVVGRRNRDLVVPDKLMSEADAFLRTINMGKSVNKETLRKHADGTLLPVNVVGYPIHVRGNITAAYYIYQDITERKSFEEQLSHQAFHDSLTNLPNRTLYMERLSRAVQRGRRRDGYNFAAMMIDLDRFKRVNDTLGHQAGDQLLVGVALRFLSCLRTVDTVARLGGDEFAILLEEFENPREVIQVANRIRDVLSEPFLIDGQNVHTAASIGIILDTRDYEHSDEILRDADIAMYQAKGRDKDRLVFNKRMHAEALEVGRMEVELRAALAEDQLALYYQPIVHVESGELQGFEALVRWNHPVRGVVGPLEFIPLAEETGLIIPMGRWVLKEACAQMARWCNQEGRGGEGMSMSVNISARQFAQPDLVEYIQGVLGASGLDPSYLKLEITESVLMDDAKQAAAKLKRLKELGIKLMIDDFGTGYSSLSYLQQFPVDYLKIDKSFISGTGNRLENREIVNTIILLARNLGLKVVAEGVEEQHQLDMLKDMKCDNAQGFMFSRPVDELAATDLLHEFLKLLAHR